MWCTANTHYSILHQSYFDTDLTDLIITSVHIILVLIRMSFTSLLFLVLFENWKQSAWCNLRSHKTISFRKLLKWRHHVYASQHMIIYLRCYLFSVKVQKWAKIWFFTQQCSSCGGWWSLYDNQDAAAVISNKSRHSES